MRRAALPRPIALFVITLCAWFAAPPADAALDAFLARIFQ